MHREYFSAQRSIMELLRHAKTRGGRILAVGTSAVRTLETLSARNQNGSGNGSDSDYSDNGLGTLQGYTELFIHPGYRFMAVDGMITNFHLPRSTPLLLACAFAGKENIFEAYRQAMALSYRFYSYGDAMLIL
jgi:S-adenosylmethionine:tRNA ribosyltransferase-isomerase